MNIIMFVKISVWHITPDSPKLLKIDDSFCSEILISDNTIEVSI